MDEKKSLLDSFLLQTKKYNFSVVLFSLPDENEFICYFQNEKLENKNASFEFRIHPFQPDVQFPYIKITPQLIFRLSEIPDQVFELAPVHDVDGMWESLIADPPAETIKEDFITGVKKTVEEIKKGSFEKAMLSAIRKVKLPNNFSVIHTLHSIRKAFPSAFVSFISTPYTGTWIGATPETLLKCKGNEITTISLAGTQLQQSVNSWGEKEIHEQEVVTRFIKEVFDSFDFKSTEVKGPENYEIGNLIHLKTTITAKISESDNIELIEKLSQAIHPTPAVGGYPASDSIQWIQQIEKHQRSYYTGFMGPVEDGNAHLFVNLRCMQIHRGEGYLYSGAGITQGSDAEKEWQETANKASMITSAI